MWQKGLGGGEFNRLDLWAPGLEGGHCASARPHWPRLGPPGLALRGPEAVQASWRNGWTESCAKGFSRLFVGSGPLCAIEIGVPTARAWET